MTETDNLREDSDPIARTTESRRLNRQLPNVVRRAPFPPSESRALGSPLQPAVVYTTPDVDALEDQYEGRAQGYTYAREGHPNADVLAGKIDALEAAPTTGLMTSSGMSAITAAVLGVLQTGDHVIAGDQLYGKSLRLLNQDLPRLGLSASLVDVADASNVAAALRSETRMVLVEIVSNPTLRIADIDGIAALCRDRGILLLIDNTFTTPAVASGFELGADLVVNSVTKLLSGHSDVTLGYVAARAPAVRQQVEDAIATWGLTPSPWDCWMAERGLHTFALRFERAQDNARRIADHLATCPGIGDVFYPGRDDHPDRSLARTLLGNNPGNMVSFTVPGGRPQANALMHALGGITFAPTLGDVSTTISHPASSSHRGLTEEQRTALGITEAFFRLSVGIEDPALLLDELSAGVAAALNSCT